MQKITPAVAGSIKVSADADMIMILGLSKKII
jgi:hypothetical protein